MALPLRAGAPEHARFESGFSPRVGAPVGNPSAAALEVARACRRAGLSFLAGTAHGWSKRELVGWLLSEYRQATVHSTWSRVWTPKESKPEAAATKRVSELLELVRIGVVASLAEAIAGPAAFVSEAIENETVVATRIRSTWSNDLVWLPIDGPRLRLETRLLALFAADYLTRPDDYARGRLRVCSTCDAVDFIDADGASSASCSCRPPASGTRLR